MNARTIARIRRFFTGPTRNELLAWVLRERLRARRIEADRDRYRTQLASAVVLASNYEYRLRTIARHAAIDNEQDPTHE